MCGIAGGWWKEAGQLDARLVRALERIRYRGPDDRGYELYPAGNAMVALGHTRLSILDLSSAGHQPMLSADKRFSIVFNGEIYNYRELRAELQQLGHRFVSDSDTEVLLAAWTQWGPECLVRLVGMFAFVVLDQQAGTMTCVRDAFGIKPLFYTQEEGNFLFASEIPALLALQEHKPELNWQRAYDYLVHGDYDTTPQTFFEGIHHLPPGHLLIVDLASGNVSQPHQWWTPHIEERSGWRFDDAVEQVREHFLQNIRLHLRSDVPLGAALSGGIDSSAVVCAMRHVEPDLPIHTFSFIASGSEVNEEHWVDHINDHVGAIPHKVVVKPVDLARDLDDMIRVQGEPFGSTSIYAQYRVFQSARESGITVTLDGQGADEMLAGYSGYPGQRLRSLVETGQLKKAWQFLHAWAQWPGRNRLKGAKMLVGQLSSGGIYSALRRVSGAELAPHWITPNVLHNKGVALAFPSLAPTETASGRRVIAELACSLHQRGLASLLRHGDRNSMRFSVESRVPFLTTELTELLLSMPEDYLISPSGETKRVFRAAMRGVVPDDVLDRKDKIGFATPEHKWLQSIAGTAREWLREPIDVPFLNQEKLVQEFDIIISGKRPFTWQAWRWINFVRWHRIFLS